MTTVMAVYNSEGCVGRCDAKCHDAHEPECVCICGGANHGAGYQRAVDNTIRWLESEIEQAGATDLLENFRKLHKMNGDPLRLEFGEANAGLQPALF